MADLGKITLARKRVLSTADETIKRNKQLPTIDGMRRRAVCPATAPRSCLVYQLINNKSRAVARKPFEAV